MSIIQKMMNFLTPPTSKEVRASLDKESLQNIFRVCTVVLCVEVTFLLVFCVKHKVSAWQKTTEPSGCILYKNDFLCCFFCLGNIC